jgi:DNA polymerase-3 subunit epsilon
MTPLTLVFDVESTGLLRPGLSVWDQPSIVEIAAAIFDDQDIEVAGFHAIVRPTRASIEPEAEAVHGISEARAHRVGVPIEGPLVLFQTLVEKATEIVAFGMEFDRKLIAAEIERAGGSGRWWTAAGSRLKCCMERATDLCRLPGKFGDWKFPTLEQAHAKLIPDWNGNRGIYQEPWKSSHRALDDVEATLRVWRAIQTYGAER